MALSQTLESPLKIPSCWAKLLEIECFNDDVYGKPIHRNTNSDPHPYRDDCRVISITNGKWTVTAVLASGSRKYWLTWSVEGPGNIYYESEPEYDIETNLESEIYLDTEEGTLILKFPVELTSDDTD